MELINNCAIVVLGDILGLEKKRIQQNKTIPAFMGFTI